MTGGLEHLEIFNSILIRPLNQGDVNAKPAFAGTDGHYLPPPQEGNEIRRPEIAELSEYVHRIDFLPHEKEKYEALQAEAKGFSAPSKEKGKLRILTAISSKCCYVCDKSVITGNSAAIV